MHNNKFPPNRFYQGFALFVYRLMGWKIEGNLPNIPKYIIVVAHHTSNWDFVVGLMAKIILRLRLRFLGKHTLFKPPLGWLMRYWGGVPVKRDKSHNVVAQIVDFFDQHEECVIALAPEGTRSPVSSWKMGFYHMAKGADVPVVPIAFDFQARRLVISTPMTMADAEEQALHDLHSFFIKHPPKRPENAWYGPFDKRTNQS
ncbi:1-acyl-sn-glycerol-3-phosphate acyltransferase [Parendozoicomonas haliclonae]|uniref:1-acyl-sn-glycerol-3-phosphate acyltransferase n=2 Tax=Parendozoicomonas haliclonae TaxID=1960125 RepID=A0A1X7ALP9_9GAMM|nr:1-acyl-sn-glycerol-3-phosphate acyltransferase [Parendozoicomonas haliclonae]